MADEGKKEAKAKKGLPIKTIGIGLIAGLLIGGGTAFFLKGGDPPPQAEAAAKGEGEKKEKAPQKEVGAEEGAAASEAEAVDAESGEALPEEEGVIFDLQPFIVNLADAPEIRYLKVTIKLDLLNAAYADDLTKHLPQIRDTLLLLLSSQEFKDIRTADGKMELRDEILQRINALFRREKVRTAYFTDFVTQ